MSAWRRKAPISNARHRHLLDDVSTSFPRCAILLLLTIVTTVKSTSTPRFVYTFCGNDTVGGSYTPNSPFESNLNSLLFTTFLNSNSSCGATNVGASTDDVVYGLFYCRGDVAGPDDCRACIQTAAARVVQDCPASKEAVIWYDACTLRYANRAFPPAEDESLWVSDQGPEDVDVDGGSASRVGYDLFNGLVRELGDVSSSSSLRYFRKGRAKVESTLRMEMSVQCSPWMSESACEACARASVGVIPSCCGWRREWVMIFRTSCEAEYRLIKTTDKVDDDDDDDYDQDDDRDSRRRRRRRAREKQRLIKDFGISTAGATTSLGFSYVVVRIYRKLRKSYRKSHKCTHRSEPPPIEPPKKPDPPPIEPPIKLPPRECPPCNPPCPEFVAYEIPYQQNFPWHSLYYG